MYKLDNTNDNYNEAPSATEAMDSSMNFLFENFINPVEDDLSEDQAYILAHIGIAFKIRSLGAEMSQGSRTWTYDEEAINYSRIIPQLLFLRFAKYSENLWNKKSLCLKKSVT